MPLQEANWFLRRSRWREQSRNKSRKFIPDRVRDPQLRLGLRGRGYQHLNAFRFFSAIGVSRPDTKGISTLPVLRKRALNSGCLMSPSKRLEERLQVRDQEAKDYFGMGTGTHYHLTPARADTADLCQSQGRTVPAQVVGRASRLSGGGVSPSVPTRARRPVRQARRPPHYLSSYPNLTGEGSSHR